LARSTAESELKLAFADFHEVAAPLDEGVNLSEDLLVLLEVPVLISVGVELEHHHFVLGDLLPLLTAVNRLGQVGNAFFNVTTEHVLLINFSLASLNNLVGDAGEEATHALRCVIRLTELEDHTDSVEDLRKELWDVLGLTGLNLAARSFKNSKEFQTVMGSLKFLVDFILEFHEAAMVGALSLGEHLNNAKEPLFLKGGLQDAEVAVALVPVLDLV